MAKMSSPSTTITWAFRGSSMTVHEIETAISIASASIANSNRDSADQENKERCCNSLQIEGVGIIPILAEEFIGLIRMQPEWESISIHNCYGDLGLCADLLLACTTHPKVGSLIWTSLTGTHRLSSLDSPTHNTITAPLLYGIKYNSNLTKLTARGLRMDVQMANLLSRALVRNTTMLALILDETTFLIESNPHNNEATETYERNMAVQTLSFGLRFNRTIESLSFDRCTNIEDKDVATLIHAVNSNETVLRKLSLKYNPCYDEGMAAIAVLLQENHIEDLDMSYLKRKRKRPEEQQTELTEEEKAETEQEEEKDIEEDDEQESDADTKDEDESHDDDQEQISTNEPDTSKDDDEEPKPPESTEKEPKEDTTNEKAPDDKVWNTSLKRLAMAGNGMDDDYLESLLGIFAPKSRGVDDNCSHLEELDLIGNCFSNHGIKEILKKMQQLPNLRRLYLGYQYPPATGPNVSLSIRQIVPSCALDKRVQFDPGSLKDDFVRAIGNTRENFSVESVNFLAMSNEDKSLQVLLNYYTSLNTSGRRILATNTTVIKTIPLGIWPLVLERANRLHPVASCSSSDENCSSDASLGEESNTANGEFHAGDVIFCLLHGPMIFENLDS